MIMISENAAPKTYIKMNSQCNCEKQECQVFHSITIGDPQHGHNQCECWSITKKRGIFKLILNIWDFTYHLAVCMWNWSLFQIPSKILNFSNAQEQIYSPKMQNKSVYKYSQKEKGRGHMSVHWKWKMLNEHRILKPFSDKFINQASYKYVRSVIYLLPLIKIRYYWGHWPCNLFVHTVHWHAQDYNIKFINC